MILPPGWISETGADADVAVTTRCRIARNVAGYPFPWRCTELQCKDVAESVVDAARRGGGPWAASHLIRGSDLSADQRALLLQWRYASPSWNPALPYRWMLISGDGAVSALANEEDHLRIQAIQPGRGVESALQTARDAERRIADSVAFARDEELGFLTASLSNTGTGIRISAFLHLVGLAASESREEILAAAQETGCAVRGIRGEGTEGTGELFQVSNRYTYGRDAATIADRVSGAARYLIEAERDARRRLFGGASGQARLKEAAVEAYNLLFRDEHPPRNLLKIVSMLRLAVAEGVMPGSLPETAEWIAIACEDTPLQSRTEERYEAIRRTSAIRQRLRGRI